MTTIDDLQADPSYKNPANGRALPRHAANPHTNVDVVHGVGGGGEGGGGSSIDSDVEYIPFVDYVEGGQVIGTAGVTMLTLSDLVPVSISGAAPFWSLPSFGSTNSTTSWKLVAPLQTVDGQNYQFQLQMSSQSTIKVLIGTEQRDLVGGFTKNFYFTGDGSIIELGLLFLPNTFSGSVNTLNVTTLESVVPESCTDFLRKIVGTTVTDLKVVGSSLVPYVVSGVVRTSCPIVTTPSAVFDSAVFEHGFSAPNTSDGKSFAGYKSLSIRVLIGSIDISDGTNTVTYPLVGDDGNVTGVNYSFHDGLTISNTISVFKQSFESSFIWTGVK